MIDVPIKLPRAAVPYVLLQRPTDLGGAGRRIQAMPAAAKIYAFYEKSQLLQRAYRWWVFNVEPLVRTGEVSRSFGMQLQGDFEEIRGFLPERALRVVDIGCGMGGIDVFLHAHYRGESGGPELLLVDKTAMSDEIYYGFHPEAAMYNSLEVTHDLLTSNGVPESDFRFIDTEVFPTEPIDNVDLVISLFAWGFHFPVATYVEKVQQMLRPGGRLILDVREETGGVQELERAFRSVEVIRDYPRSARVCAIQP